MAKTLKQFLEERARRDFLSAEFIYKNAIIGLGTDRRLQEIQKQSQLARFFDSPALSGSGTRINKRGLHRISLMMLSVAGEAVKKLEDEVPDIHDRFPSFPWKHFKRLRDLNVKYGEAATSGEDIDKITLKMNAEVEAINELGAFDALNPAYKDLPYFYLICVCINWGSAIDEFANSSLSDYVSASPSPALKELSRVIGMSEAAIPIFFEGQSSRDLLNGVHEQIKQESLFFRRLHSKLYDKVTLETLKQLRNKYAHFEDFFEADSKTTPEAYCLDLVMFDEKEFASLKRVYLNIVGQLWRVREALYYDEIDDYAMQMAGDYEYIVLGSVCADSAKRKLMDEQIEWVTKNTAKPRNVDAFVIATGDLLQRSTIDEAKDALQYIRLRKNELGKPNELLKDIGGQSYVLQENLRRFVDSMQYSLGVKNLFNKHT